MKPIDVETVLPWVLPQKMKRLVNPRTDQDGDTQNPSNRVLSDETRTEQEEIEETSSNGEQENNSSKGIDREKNCDEAIGKAPQGMTINRDSSYNRQLNEENNLEPDQIEGEPKSSHDGAEKESDASKEDRHEANRGKVEESFALSEILEMRVLQLYGMLQSRSVKKRIDISADGRGPKGHGQGSTGWSIAWIPTIIQGISREQQLPIQLIVEDVRYAMHQEIPKEAIYLVVDTSGSMGQRHRLNGTEKLLSQLVQMMYVKRQYVSLITFQKQGAQCVVPLTKRIETIPKALGETRIGGRTPFVTGIEEAVRQISIDMSQMGHVQAKVVIITDGKVTSQALQGLDEIGRWLANQGIQTTVIDTDSSFVRMNRAKEIARMLGAELIDRY